MPIVPSGKVRVMKAQNVREFGAFKEIFAQMENDFRSDVTQQNIPAGGQETNAVPQPAAQPGEQSTEQQPTEQQQGQEQPQDNQHGQPLQIQQQQQQADSSKFHSQLVEFINHTLVSWHWPERLLQERKDDMVDENIAADGNKTVKIIVPNVYGDGSGIIDDQNFSTFINQVSQRFGLHFSGGNRRGKKAELNFTTTQQNQVGDPLDEVYGTPGRQKQPRKAAAYTLGEMLKARRDSLHDIMSKIAHNMEKK